MRLFEATPIIAGAGLAVFMLIVVWRGRATQRSAWMLPAALSVLFLAWSVTSGFTEGPLGFWAEHTRNMWSNQIWLDLLLAAGVGWFLMAPRARAVQMSLLPWMFFVLATGSVGFLAMASRLLYLEERRA
jgi:hypothetical protein